MPKAQAKIPAKPDTTDKPAASTLKPDVILCDLYAGKDFYKLGTPVSKISNKELVKRLVDKNMIGGE